MFCHFFCHTGAETLAVCCKYDLGSFHVIYSRVKVIVQPNLSCQVYSSLCICKNVTGRPTCYSYKTGSWLRNSFQDVMIANQFKILIHQINAKLLAPSPHASCPHCTPPTHKFISTTFNHSWSFVLQFNKNSFQVPSAFFWTDP